MNENLYTNECFNCFNEMNPNDKLIMCKKCSICIHNKCYKLWLKKNNIVKALSQHKCLHCQQNDCLKIINQSCVDKLKSCFR